MNQQHVFPFEYGGVAQELVVDEAENLNDGIVLVGVRPSPVTPAPRGVRAFAVSRSAFDAMVREMGGQP